MKYALDEKPGFVPLLLYGLQWWVVSLPAVVIMGLVAARLHYPEIQPQTFYMQKLFMLTGATTVLQVFWGHRLPLVVGPASTLLVGLVASVGAGVNATYTAILIGGLLLALAAYSGFLSRLRYFFTSRIIAVILILIACTLMPTILRLIHSGQEQATFHLVFALGMVLALILCNTLLPGIWKSLTVLLGLIGGSYVYFLIFDLSVPSPFMDRGSFPLLLGSLDFHLGSILSFLFCYLALTINELGSIEAIGHMLRADGMTGRVRRGAGMQGLVNMVAGGMGVIGPVDYSMSAGMIAATGCASRYTLVPAGIGLFLCGAFPGLVFLFFSIPGAVMGSLLFYLMASQFASGLALLVEEKGIANFNNGITVALPLMTGLLIAFSPPSVFNAFPELLRSIIGNGFVMGTLMVIFLEHVMFRKKPCS